MTKIDGRTERGRRAPDRRLASSACRPITSIWCSITRSSALTIPTASSPTGGAMEAVAGRKEGRQDSLHRVHRPQRSAHPSLHAESCGATTVSISTPCRCRSNVMDAHFRSFATVGPAGTGETADRRARHEVHGRRRDSEKQNGVGHRMPALRSEPANFGGDHRHR